MDLGEGSEAGVSVSEELFGVRKEALRLIPPSVPALEEPTEEQRSELRAKHGIPQSVPVWIYPGDLEYGGGATIAVQGFTASSQRDGVLLMACREKTARISLSSSLSRGRMRKQKENC